MPNTLAFHAPMRPHELQEISPKSTNPDDVAETLEKRARRFRELAETAYGDQVIQELYRLANDLDIQANALREFRCVNLN